MNYKHQKLCLWSGIIFILLYGVGLWPVAGLLPPMKATMNAREVVAFYQHQTNSIRFGLLLMMGACGFFVPFVALISEQLKRIPSCGTSIVNKLSWVAA